MNAESGGQLVSRHVHAWRRGKDPGSRAGFPA